jgi:hypothetical protein
MYTNLIKLEDFYAAINRYSKYKYCSYCTKETLVYAVKTGLLPIKPTVINLCGKCLELLPNELSVINLNSIGSPPLLIYKIYKGEV